MADIYDVYGYWQDIQTAVNMANVGDSLHLKSGVFDFIDVGEDLHNCAVQVRGGVSLLGAPTSRTSGYSVPTNGPNPNNQVIGVPEYQLGSNSPPAWQTTLRIPWECPTDSAEDQPPMFIIGSPNTVTTALTRFSDIKLVGARELVKNSMPDIHNVVPENAGRYMYCGLLLEQLHQFRIDHCHFLNLCGSALYVGSYMEYYNHRTANGVIDHCILENCWGDPGFFWNGVEHYYQRTLGYGIGLRRWASPDWDPITVNVLGKDTANNTLSPNHYSIFIEDNYFGKWRHGSCSNDGFHQIYRHNLVTGGYGVAEADGHGSYADDGAPYAVGTRALEVYNNIFQNPDSYWNPNEMWAINHRGGAGIFTNNQIIGYVGGLMDLNDDWGNVAPYRPDCAIHDTYIWGNNTGGAPLIHYNGAVGTEGVDWFFRAPSQSTDGFSWTPYTYPHPLVVDDVNQRLRINSNPSGIPFTLIKL